MNKLIRGPAHESMNLSRLGDLVHGALPLIRIDGGPDSFAPDSCNPPFRFYQLACTPPDARTLSHTSIQRFQATIRLQASGRKAASEGSRPVQPLHSPEVLSSSSFSRPAALNIHDVA